MIEELQIKLQSELPGSSAHRRMIPAGRQLTLNPPDNAIRSAVMVLLFDIDKKWNTILIRRTQDGRTHSGQISFPGGKMEKFDQSLVQTAIRECEEEIGVRRQDITIVGSLSGLYIPPSNFWVEPIVGYINTLQQFKASEKEVAEIIQVPLELLFLPETKTQARVQPRSNPSDWIETPAYELSDDLCIWGATAMIISELEALIVPAS